MVILMVVLTVVIFAAVDLTLRLVLRRMAEKRARRERSRALDLGLELNFADEAGSLRRIEVPAARACILAVDDEPVVLDSFRKILVLAGYSVDTVESGEEALTLVRANDYDLVFTDLKMPTMDGIQVIKGVRHLRPDVDVAVITGYGTIETAVDSMRLGAVDYVQKPFTEDELVEFANRLLIRRQDRRRKMAPLEVRPVTPSRGGASSPSVINVPGGVYLTPEHTWVSVEITGEGRIGLDDLFHKTVGEIDSVELPEPGRTMRRGEPLFTLHRGDQTLSFASPLSGRVKRVNHELDYHPALMVSRPYEQGWICSVEPSELTADLERLRIGADAVEWFRSEIERYRAELATAMDSPAAERPASAGGEPQRRSAAQAFSACFLTRQQSPAAATV